MCPIAHVLHCPCGPLPMWPIPCPYPLYPIPLYPLWAIAHVLHTPCTPYPPYHILTVPLCPCGSHCPCALYLLYPIALITHVADCPMGDRSDGAHGQWGNSIKGVWGTGGIGHMGNGSTGGMGYGPHGQWVQGV